jgi:hypothetical protein
MLTRFSPRLDALPSAQRKIWPKLGAVPHSFVLYGGTAIALRLGHRQSVDFDFFSTNSFTIEQLEAECPILVGTERLQAQPNTLTVLLHAEAAVKLSFFGGLEMGRVGDPQLTSDGVLQVASLLDLAATKLKVIQERAEKKDYLDLAELIEAGIKLSESLGAARALFGDLFNPMISLKALSFFEDGDLPSLPTVTKTFLRKEAKSVSALPSLTQKSQQLA